MALDSAWDVADHAAEVLGPESNRLTNPDVAELGRAMAVALRGAANRPVEALNALSTFFSQVVPIPGIAFARWLGADVPPPMELDPKDRRFSDATWAENPYFYGLRMYYAAMGQLSHALIDSAAMDELTREKAEVGANLLLDTLAPTNFLPTNPAALKRAFETGGKSLALGFRNFLDDLVNNRGRPRQVDTTPFVLGENMAATPSKVVYRNELMELLQYEPQTPDVHAVPLLCSPPWINKYYIMDLSPGRSFIEWAVKHGRTVFAISYLNPPAELSNVTMDDYLLDGPHTALDVIEDITGADKIDIVGLCLGGALTTIAAAYLTASGDARVGTLTLLNTMLDYTDPGVLKVFTDERTVAADGTTWPPARRRDGRYVRHHPGQRPDLQLCRVQLAYGAIAAGIRHPRVERGQHTDAGGDAYVLPAQLLHREPPRQGRTRDRRSHHQLGRHQAGFVRRCRAKRPHCAVAVRVRRDAVAFRAGSVCAHQRWSHRRHCQPAGAEGLVRHREETATRSRRVAQGRRAARRFLVGGLGEVVRRARWIQAEAASHGQQALSGAVRRPRRVHQDVMRPAARRCRPTPGPERELSHIW
jgi:Poly-beta-hydroxybutyrate polymerase (PhaC) N-terminus